LRLMPMKPTYQTDAGTIYQGHALEVLRAMPDQSVNCCVTSPPYWGLRDYGVPGQLGLEPTPEEYTANMVEVFREVRRVLADDGTLWLNLGDSYATGAGKVGDCPGGGAQGERFKGYRGTRDGDPKNKYCMGPMIQPNRMPIPGLKPKDLIGIPWRVAFALQADGWYLRSDIIWHKPNPMPESVTDRPTKSHEYIFLMAKSARYYYDHEAVKEPDANTDHPRHVLNGQPALEPSGGIAPVHSGLRRKDGRNGLGRNKRTVWTVSTKPFKEAHFATFPPCLIEPCILAGCPRGGTVLDPFFGSGTTGVVCWKHDRKFIGIDLSKTYLEDIAIPRIERDTKQLKLFTELTLCH